MSKTRIPGGGALMADKRDGKKVGIDQETRKRDKTDAAKGLKVFLCHFLTYR